MSSPVGTGRERRGSPTPFSSEWTSSPPAPPRPRRFEFHPDWLPDSMPAWFPSERLLSALVVLGLVCAAAFTTGGGADDGQRSSGDAGSTVNALGLSSDDDVPAVGGAEDDEPEVAVEPSAGPTETPEFAASPTEIVTATVNLDQPETVAAPDGSILPQYRILAYYGHPHDSNMGILGQYGVDGDLDGLRLELEEQAEEYQKADPSRPIKLAFEVIATVAQGTEQEDGTWLLNTDAPTIQEYIDYAAEHDMLIFLDVQIGRRGVEAELEVVREWLEYPHVHLALDPEFAIEDGQTPGRHIGSITAADVQYAQEYLAGLTAELGLPPKVLIVHQFLLGMIKNKEQIEPYPGVQLVVDMDGHGPPDTKLNTYGAVISSDPIEFNGVKLFYDQDLPLLTPREIIGLDPSPDLIIYQ